jgi:hypothetical protein
LFGIQTFYHREKDGSLSIKLLGEVKDVPLFEQVCVLREVDLHYKWAPFCSSSMTVAELDKLDVVGWFLVGLQKFGLARDGCFRVLGCDHTMEDGSILLTGHGIQDKHHAPAPPSTVVSSSIRPPPLSKLGNNSNISDKKDKKTSCISSDDNGHDDIGHSSSSNSSSSSRENHNSSSSSDYDFLSQDELLKLLPIPPVPTRRGAGRMTIRRFDAIITATSPTSASTIIIANVDPNISFLHSVLLEFVVKHLAGVMLFQLQGAARKAVKHPVTNEHAKRMRAEEAFYKYWLLPKFQAFCAARGWEMPRVAAFELTSSELQRENISAWNNQKQKQQQQQYLAKAVTEPDLQHEPTHHAATATTTPRRAVTFYEGSNTNVNDTDHEDDIDDPELDNNPRHQKRFVNRRRTMTDPPPSFDLSMRQSEDDGLVNHQRHHHHHHHDHDLMSDLSSRSGHHPPWPLHALTKGGPVVRFIRQQEIKQVRKQEHKVEQARQKIYDMLKPKELDEQQMKRLQQLKLAKARRLAEEQGADLSSASFLLSPLKRSDSAPSLTQLAALDSDAELPIGTTTTSGMALTSLDIPTTVSSRLPLGLAESRPISPAASTTQGLSLEHQQEQKQRQLQMTAPSIVLVPKRRPLHRRRSFLRFVTDRLYTHGRTKKVFVVSLMVALLFVSLHPRLLLQRMKPPKFLQTYNASETTNPNQLQWREAAACLCLDVVTSLYLCGCAILHFFLCDISLIYAFDSLELGAKTGRQVRKFYIDNVRFPVAMTSFGIVALSLLKALSLLGLRAGLWFLLVSYNTATGWSSSSVKKLQDLIAKMLPAIVGGYHTTAVALWDGTCLLVQEVMRVCLATPFKFVVQHAFRSNWLGRSTETQLLLLVNKVTTLSRGAIDAFEGKIEVAPWRVEAFETARTLFAYTAIFLVNALILFSISARQKRRAGKTVRINSRAFNDDISIRTGVKEELVLPAPAAVVSPPATTASLKDDIIRKQDSGNKSNNIARLESSLQSFGFSQHDADSVDSSQNNSNSNSSSSDKKANGVLRFRKSTSFSLQ